MIKITEGQDHGSTSCYTCFKAGTYSLDEGRFTSIPEDLHTLRIGGRQNTNCMTMCSYCLRELSVKLLDFVDRVC
jgi:hypothetical protein